MKKLLLISLLTSVVSFSYVAASNHTAIQAATSSYIENFDIPALLPDDTPEDEDSIERPECPRIEFMESDKHEFVLIDKKKWYGEILPHIQELHLYAHQLEQLLDLPPPLPKPDAPAPSKPATPKKKLY